METNLQVNLDGRSEMLNNCKPPNHIPRHSNMVPPFSLHPNNNTHEWHLQKRINKLEEVLKEECAEWTRGQAKLEKAITHAVCIGWEVKLLQEQLNRKKSGEEMKGIGYHPIHNKCRCSPDIGGMQASQSG